MDKETITFMFNKLDDRIQSFQKDLEKLTKLKEDDTDLNPVAIDDILFVMELSMNTLIQFKKELLEDLKNEGVEYDG